MLTEGIFSEFTNLLHARLLASVLTTEDSIRYTFFHALLVTTHLNPHDIILEFPHPTISGAKVDTFIPSLDGEPIAIEFKYDRIIPSGSSAPRTQNAGELFADMYRLSQFSVIPEPDRTIIYCTDHIMAQYYRKPENGYSGFFDLPCLQKMEIGERFLNNKRNTFRKYIQGTLSIALECLWAASLPADHVLRIYRVRRI